MLQCNAVREQMPLLLTEALEPETREQAHSHIEVCSVCELDWKMTRNTWSELANLPELPLPSRARARFSAYVDESRPKSNVVPFRKRPLFRQVAQAAVLTLLVGGSFVAGRQTGSKSVLPAPLAAASQAFSISESSVIPASLVNPEIQGRPDIQNVRFFDSESRPEEIGVSFDVTSRVMVTGTPEEKNMVRLLSYFLQNHESSTLSRSNAIQWVRDQYGSKDFADPEIARALANLLKNDTHEGVRIKAVEALKSLPPAAAPDVRDALVQALKNDPNPAVRIKAVEGLADLARSANSLDSSSLDTLRQKASQNDENAYVRVKAAEALSHLNL